MDIISAYREVGTYRGAAAISGTTPKTVRRVIARHESGGARRPGQPRGRNYDAVVELVAERVEQDRRAGSARSGCCRPPGRRATRGRRATSGGWSRRGKRCGATTIIVVGGRRCGPRVSIWSSTGACWAGCTCSARCWPGRRVRFVRFADNERADTTLALLAECFEHPGRGPRRGAGRPDGLPEGRGGREQGRAHGRVRAFRRAPRVPPRLLRGRRPGVEGDRGEPGRLRQDRPDDPRRRRVRRCAVHRPRGGERRCRGVVCRGQRRGALRDLRGAGRAAGHRAGAAGAAALAAGRHRPVGDPQGRPALLCPVRLGALLGPGPVHRRPGPAARRPRPDAVDHRRPR